MRGKRGGEATGGRREGRRWRRREGRGLSGNVAEEALCLKSAPCATWLPGRQPRCWLDNIIEWTGLNIGDAVKMRNS